LPIKKSIAMEAIRKEKPVIDIARRYNCSRNTVYEQQRIACLSGKCM